MTQPLRVLSVSTLFPCPARPSLGLFVANQMKALAARAIDLVMVNPLGIAPWPLSRRDPYAALSRVPAVTDLDGLQVHHPRFTAIPAVGADSNPGRLASALLPLARRFHAERPFDLVDAQFFFPDGPAAAAIARDLALPLSIKARGADIHFWGTRARSGPQVRAAGRQATGLLAVSRALARDMAALGMPADRITVHYTGLDHARFRPLPRADARHLVPALPAFQGRLIVTTGALIPRKGQVLVIEALGSLGRSDVHLAIAGAGPDETMLRERAAKLGLGDRVHFLGQVGHEALPALLAAADIMVLPSSSEGLANAWIEALACGTPIVIPDIGGAREVVRDVSAGRIAGREPPAIAAAIDELLNDPPSQSDVAANAAGFSWERNAELLEAHYRRILES